MISLNEDLSENITTEVVLLLSFKMNVKIIRVLWQLTGRTGGTIIEMYESAFSRSCISFFYCECLMNQDLFVSTGLRQPSAGSPLCLCSRLLLVIVFCFLPAVVVTLAVWGKKWKY